MSTQITVRLSVRTIRQGAVTARREQALRIGADGAIGTIRAQIAVEVDAAPPSEILNVLLIDEPNGIVLGSSPVYSGDEAVGYVISASYAFPSGTALAYVWLPIVVSTPETVVKIGSVN